MAIDNPSIARSGGCGGGPHEGKATTEVQVGGINYLDLALSAKVNLLTRGISSPPRQTFSGDVYYWPSSRCTKREGQSVNGVHFNQRVVLDEKTH
jgi:hypothetical protein